jgi:hypothetical protein
MRIVRNVLPLCGSHSRFDRSWLKPKPPKGARPLSSARRSVKILMIGQPDDVELTIARLYQCHFCRVEDWSLPWVFRFVRWSLAFLKSLRNPIGLL